MIGRKPNAVARFTMVAAVLLISTSAFGQTRGAIAGTITPAAATVVVIATNQVTSEVTRTETDASGKFAIKVRPGAYRLSVAPPFVARFDKTKTYGEHALIRDDSIENVIVSDGKETKIDFAIEKIEEKPIANVPPRKPLGAAGNQSVQSKPQKQSDRREVRDRWRIGFPE